MTLTVRILPRAKADFYDIFSYIERHSPVGADRWRDALELGLQRVSENHATFGFAQEDRLTQFPLRQLLFKTKHGLAYRAVFTVIDDVVLVLRVRGPGQPPLKSDEMPLA